MNGRCEVSQHRAITADGADEAVVDDHRRMAATNPAAVANSASAMPGATTARFVVCACEIPMKLSMMPHTVPNNPMNGAVEPMVARSPVARINWRPSVASVRSSRDATRSLIPTAGAAPDSLISFVAARIIIANGSRRCPSRNCSSASVLSASASVSARRNRALASATSTPLANRIVQVTTEALTRPIMTARTTPLA